jgi:cytochrome c oxidase cbb3-type subunit 3
MSRFLLLIALAAAHPGCDRRPTESPQGGAPPPVKTPVGTIPGPGVQAPVATNPFGSSPLAARAGRQWFLGYNCAGCHGGHAGGGMGPSLRDKTWRYGSSSAHIFDSIAEGRSNGMPAWGVKLPEEHIWQLVSYIQTLGTEEEVNPPTPIPPPPQQ